MGTVHARRGRSALVAAAAGIAAATALTLPAGTAAAAPSGSAVLPAEATALAAATGTDATTARGVDARTNQVVVTISSSAPAAKAAALEKTAARYGSAVRVQRAGTGFRTTLEGGEAIYTNTGGRCSAGFNTTGGVLTAGHCTAGYPSWTVSGGGYLGESAGSSFPGNDYGLISNTGQPAYGSVYLYGGGSQSITGAGDAVAGQSICKSGSTTGVTCGSVLATGVTVNYAEGAVYDTVQTNVCVQPGDSGGSWFSGSTAIGITSGASVGACSQSGFQSFFQPVTEALAAYGVSLI